MPTYVALLRGINVGGHKQVAMADLRDLVTRMGFEDARTLLQSGNLVFRGKARTDALLERQLEAELQREVGMQVDVFVRSAEQWKAVVARNPFREEADKDPGHLLVLFLRSAPQAGGVEALRASIKGREVVRTDGSHAYVVYPDGVGRSRLTLDLIERKLGTRGTGRNWNTVVKLGALAGA